MNTASITHKAVCVYTATVHLPPQRAGIRGCRLAGTAAATMSAPAASAETCLRCERQFGPRPSPPSRDRPERL